MGEPEERIHKDPNREANQRWELCGILNILRGQGQSNAVIIRGKDAVLFHVYILLLNHLPSLDPSSSPDPHLAVVAHVPFLVLSWIPIPGGHLDASPTELSGEGSNWIRGERYRSVGQAAHPDAPLECPLHPMLPHDAHHLPKPPHCHPGN